MIARARKQRYLLNTSSFIRQFFTVTPLLYPTRSRHGGMVGLASLLLVANSCTDPSSAAPDTREAATTAPFRSAYVLRDSVVLEQSDTALIVRLSGIDRNDAGEILIGDVSEGDVKLFAPDGRLIRVIGRKGKGPGEFSAPRFPRFGPDGRIYVADAQDPRIQVFDASGTLVSATRIAEGGTIMGFEPLRGERYLLAVERGPDDHVLLEVDTSGMVRRQFLAIAGVRPTGQGDFPLWRNIRAFSLAVSGDTAFVSSTLSDSLWRVHLPSGTESRTQLSFPGYIPPAPPAQMPEGIPGLVEWNKSFHASSTLSASDAQLYLPYVQGVLNYGDPMLLLGRNQRGWSVFSDAPPLIGTGGGMAIGLLTPNQEEIALGLFAPRSE